MQATIDPSVLLMAGGNSADATLRITAPPDDSVRDADVVIHSSSGSIHGDDDVVHVARYVGQVETISAASGNEPWLNQPGDAVTLTGAGLCNAGVRFGDGGPIAHAIDADANGHRLTVRVPFGALNGDLAVMRNGIAMTTTADTQIASTHQRWPGSFTATSYRHRFGFPFANWGGWHPTIDEAVRLFGEDQVYVQVNPCGPWSFGIINCGGSTPVEKPSTAFFLEGIDSAVSASGGGRCFGVSLDSVRDLLNGSPASYFSGDDFTRSEIDVLHLAQFSQPVEDYRLGGAGKYSSTDDLEHAIGAYTGQGQPVLVNIEDGGRGHTVVAYLTERDNDGNLVIHTYNPNEPFTSSESIHAGDRQDVENRSTIIVTPGGHWSFAGLQQDDKSPWQGDLSTIEALPFADVPLDHPLIGDQNWQAFVPLGSLSITAPNGALARGVRRLPDLDGSSTAAAYALPASGAYKIALTAAQERHPFLITGGPIQARIVAGGASSAGPDVVSLDRRGVSFAASSGHRKLAIELVAPQHDGSQRVAYVSTSGARTLRVALAAGGGVALNGSGGAMTVRGELASVGRSAGAQRTLLPALRLADHGRIILRPTSWRALSQLPLNILTSQGGQLRTGQLRPRDVTRVPFRIAASSQALHDRKATVELRLRLRRGVPASGVRVLWIVMRGRQIIARHVLRLSGGQARPGVDRLVWTTGRLRRGRLTVLVVAFAAGSDRHGLPQTFIVHTTKTLEVR
jgi:hypothetical protein